MTDLALQITELQAEFQRVAEHHPWVWLYVPAWNREHGLATAGDADSDPPGPRLGIAPRVGVKTIDLYHTESRLYDLTRKAQGLLSRVLEQATAIPLRVKQGIQEWEQQFRGGGWLRWLWEALPSPSTEPGEQQGSFPPAQARRLADLGSLHPADPYGGYAVANYASAAALALSVLDEAASPPVPSGDREHGKVVDGQGSKGKRPRGRKPDTDAKADQRVADAWRSGRYRTLADLARELKVTGRDVELALDRVRWRERSNGLAKCCQAVPNYSGAQETLRIPE